MGDPMLLAATSGRVLIELGGVLLGLAVVGRFAGRLGLPSIPLYLLAGLALGEGGVVGLDASSDFVRVGADLGVVLLLLLLGLEHSPAEIRRGLQANAWSGVVDVLANFAPGLIAGWILGWGPLEALLLGGITYVSSSGIIAKLLADLRRTTGPESSVIVSILVMEDLVMAVYLPVVAVLVAGFGVMQGVVSAASAVVLLAAALYASTRYSRAISRIVDTTSAEALLLTVLGLTFLIGGLVEEVQISAAIGAFLLGVTLSGNVAERGRELLAPVRDVFGGLFFVFFGLQIDPETLPPALFAAVGLALASAATKIATGWSAARRADLDRVATVRTALSLVPRGEFSIIIAGIAVSGGADPRIAPIAAAYVLLLAVFGSIAVRYSDEMATRRRRREPALR